MPSQRTRRLALSAAAITIVFSGALGLNAVMRDVQAQTDETLPGDAMQTPPAVPGLEYPDPGATGTLPLDPSLVPATPMAPVDAAGAAGLVETPDGVTTNLGGSDVAVTSEGGSYEVDGPRRKGKRFPAPTPKP